MSKWVAWRQGLVRPLGFPVENQYVGKVRVRPFKEGDGTAADRPFIITWRKNRCGEARNGICQWKEVATVNGPQTGIRWGVSLTASG